VKAGRNVVSTTPIAKAGSCDGTPSLAVVLQAFIAIAPWRSVRSRFRPRSKH